jgi:hypothetical protein
MNRKPQSTTWLAAAVIGIVSTAALAEDVTVKLPAASILSEKSARSTKVATLRTGDKLQVLAHEGSWLKVKFNDKQGYIHENSVGGGNTGKSLSSELGTMSGASKASDALASRGVGEGATAWAKTHNMSTAGLDKMIAIRNSITDADQRKFDADLK